MNKQNKGRIAAITAVAILVALAVLWGIAMRPAAPEAVPHPTPEQLAAEDSALTVNKKEKKPKRDSTSVKKRHVPKQRDFLNEPVPSE